MGTSVSVLLCLQARSGDTRVSAGWNSLEAHAEPRVKSGFLLRPFASFYWGADLNQSILKMVCGWLVELLKEIILKHLKGQIELHP